MTPPPRTLCQDVASWLSFDRSRLEEDVRCSSVLLDRPRDPDSSTALGWVQCPGWSGIATGT